MQNGYFTLLDGKKEESRSPEMQNESLFEEPPTIGTTGYQTLGWSFAY
jgi:hypothetical protein